MRLKETMMRLKETMIRLSVGKYPFLIFLHSFLYLAGVKDWPG